MQYFKHYILLSFTVNHYRYVTKTILYVNIMLNIASEGRKEVSIV